MLVQSPRTRLQPQVKRRLNAYPQLTGSGDLSWAGQSFIRPSATWTDLSSASRGQFLVLLLGALIGIFGSAFVAVVIDWIRGPNKQN